MIEELLKNVTKKTVITKFLTIEEQVSLPKQYKVILYPEYCERKRAIVSKDGIDFYEENISLLKILYNKKFGNIGHRDVLGSLIGLGIKRECIGDIIISDNIYVFVTSEMEEYIINNLCKISNVSVDVIKCSFEEIKDIDINNYVEDEIIVSSYRLDTIISERCCLSREKAKQYITLKNVKINGVINTNPDYVVKINDLISIHKFGRLIVKEEIKITKKNKFVLKIWKTK